MPISSGNSQGSMKMTIQPPPHNPPSGNMSVLEASQIGALTMNSLFEDHLHTDGVNYQNVYQNPDLETALLSRGFSQLRPEILGVFEFTPPLTEDILTAGPSGAQVQGAPWSARPTYSTNAAELFDLQCQLKQLRYTEALKFLSQQMNLSTEEVGSGIQLNPNDEGGIYLEPFDAEMGAAKDILDWLTIGYNSVTTVLEAMDIKSAPHIDIVNINSKIYESLRMYDPDAITIAPENLTLQEYMKSSSGLELPDGWWSSATQTQIIAQLILDVVMRLIYPIKAYSYPPGWEGNVAEQAAGVDDVEFNPGTVLGLDYLYNSGLEETITGAILQLRYLHVDSLAISESSSMGLSSFSKGDFQSLRAKFIDADEIGMALYAFASDLMIRAALERDTVDMLSGIENTASSFQILKKIYGASPNTHNIANISPNVDPDSMIMRLMPKDVDPDTHVDRKISTFQYSSHKMPQGNFPLRTGKSYFLDDIVTKDVADVMVRLSELSSNLTYIKEKLIQLVTAFNSPNSVASHQPYIEEGKLLASSLVWDVFRQGSAVINQVLLAIESGAIDPFVKICVATAAAENSNIAWSLFKYVIYKTLYQNGYGDAWKSSALMSATTLITDLLELHPGLTGEIDKMNRTDIDMGGGNVTVSASEDTGVSGVYAGIQLSQLHSITTPEMLAVFDNDIEIGDPQSGIGDLFDIGYVGMNVWIRRLRGTYGLLPSSLLSLTGPNLKSSYLGGVAICFFWQLQVYREALGFKQVAGEAHLGGQAVEGGA